MIGLEKDAAYEKVFVSDYLTTYAHSKDRYLLADWKGVLDATTAKNGCLAVLDSLKKYPFEKVLNNNTNVTGHYPGAIDWVGKVWFPSMHDLGVRWFAWVYSPDFYTQIGTDVIINLSSRVTIETFYSILDAYIWLNQKPISKP
ncbi:hypothetical protein ACSX1A_07290 [Pontibacter sp. MBLB2868]|uniref:hypothetical protein n=1 Tax=Pontibacter sp. MBLB2868 TaxID=3451555 RepID=UPI003F755F8B